MSVRHLPKVVRSMAKAKAKTQKKLQNKAHALTRATQQSRNKSANRESGLDWNAAVAALKSEQFANLDQAMQAVAERVLNRLGKNLQNEAAEREFLVTLLRTDPQVQAQLKRLLNVKN